MTGHAHTTFSLKCVFISLDLLEGYLKKKDSEIYQNREQTQILKVIKEFVEKINKESS